MGKGAQNGKFIAILGRKLDTARRRRADGLFFSRIKTHNHHRNKKKRDYAAIQNRFQENFSLAGNKKAPFFTFLKKCGQKDEIYSLYGLKSILLMV